MCFFGKFPWIKIGCVDDMNGLDMKCVNLASCIKYDKYVLCVCVWNRWNENGFAKLSNDFGIGNVSQWFYHWWWSILAHLFSTKRTFPHSIIKDKTFKLDRSPKTEHLNRLFKIQVPSVKFIWRKWKRRQEWKSIPFLARHAQYIKWNGIDNILHLVFSYTFLFKPGIQKSKFTWIERIGTVRTWFSSVIHDFSKSMMK